jgi:AcrR family transcriptional regulator
VSRKSYADPVSVERHVDPRVERTRTRVLAAARALFLTDGLGALTHLEVSRRSGVGRRTLYRHWPTTDDLVHDTLASANFPRGERVGDLDTDLRAHLRALRRALVDGPLAFVIHALGERAAIRPELRDVRDRLVTEGCAPVREILRDAIADRSLPADLDVEATAAQLEGPLFYRALVLAEPIPDAAVDDLVDAFLATVR